MIAALRRAGAAAAVWGMLACGAAAQAQSAAGLSFSEVFERHAAVMLLVEPVGGAIIDANPAAARFYGFERDALRAMNIAAVNSLTPEQITAERQLAQSEGRNYFIFRHRLRSGELRTVEVRSNPFVVDGRTLLLSIVQDVTPQRRDADAEALWHYQNRLEEMVDAQVRAILAGEQRWSRALGVFGAVQMLLTLVLAVNILRRRRSEQRFRDVSEAAGEFIWETDLNGKFSYVSDRVRLALGYDPTALIGRSMISLVAKPDRRTFRHVLSAIRAEGDVIRGLQQRIRHGDGHDVWLVINGLPRRDWRGRVAGYRGAALDVTQTKKMEMERERMLARLARSNEEMERLAEVMAHHFQEPARRIVSFSQRLHKKSDGLILDPDAKLSLDFIESEARRLRDLVRDVQRYLAAGRGDPPKAPTDAAAILAEDLARRDPPPPAAARIEIGPLPQVWVEPRRLSDLFSALLDNALRHRPEGRALVLQISAQIIYKRAVFRFADNGPGVPLAYRSQVFRLFERLPIPGVARLGAGVGLSVARKVVENAGGRIYIEDGLDGGCSVVFDLPLEASAP